MIHNDVLSQLQFLIKTSAPPLIEVSQQPLESPQWVPGEKVQAHVVANLPNGRFQVLIADKTLDMNLPRNTQPGDSLELTFVTDQPRLTFVLSRDLVAAQPGKAAVSLSETARFLGALLQKVSQSPADATTAPLARTPPLLSGPPASIPDFAQALRSAVSQSGLFYESHQAQWVNGQRPLSDLLMEPQGRLSSLAAARLPRYEGNDAGSLAPQLAENADAAQAAKAAKAAGSSVPQFAGTEKIAGSPAPQSLGTTDGVDLRAPQTAGTADAVQVAKAASPEQPAHPDTLPLVRQQLDVLDARQVVWQGQVWPGQSMEWQIEERKGHEHDPDAPAEWQTRLRLDLPRLGEVGAVLVLSPQGLRIRLDTNDAATAGLMREYQPALQSAVEAAGLKLAELAVRLGDVHG